MAEEGAMTYGPEAASRLEPYRPQIFQNHELPGHFGRLMSAWDDPKFVRASEARHMREDDYVLGLVHQGIARAYPIWVIDHYHVINDVIAGDPIVVASCDACQSGSAFLARLEGQRVKFAVAGIYNATFLMIDRSGMFERQGSLWLHYEGVAIAGRYQGTLLPFIPGFHTTWRDWRAAHPETEVMLAPEDRHHRDARHGHGRGEYFSRPGINPSFLETITGALDGRYPEHEMVLGINADQGITAYPLREVTLSGGVVHDQLGQHPVVVFAGPRPEQFTMAAYSRLVDGQALSFRRRDGSFLDEQTQTEWTIEGEAIQGPLAGRRLTPLRWQYLRWHAWVYSHRTTALYRHRAALPIYPDGVDGPALGLFEPVLKGLSTVGRMIALEGPIVTLRLPHEAEQGLCLWVDRDRLNLYRFTTTAAAEDYAALQGAWYCIPDGGKKVGRKVSRRAGIFVLESDPEIQYADPAQIVRLPDPAIRWSDLVRDPEPIRTWSAGIPDGVQAGRKGFTGLIEHLKRGRYDVVNTAFLPHSQLRVGAVSVVTATINAEPFVIYKCDDVAAAARVVSEVPHAFHAGRLVLRSVPHQMYRDPDREVAQRPDEEIQWGTLLADARFIATVTSYANA